MEVIGKHPHLNRGEFKVLDWLEKSFQNEDGYILVEPPLNRKDKNPFWPDFVILSPTHGICIIECKSFESAKIRSISSIDELKTNDEVIRYKLQLRNYTFLLKQMTEGLNVRISKCVIFPLIAEREPVSEELRKYNEDSREIGLYFRNHMNWDASLELLVGDALTKKLSKKELREILHLINPERIFDHNLTLDLGPIQQKVKLFDESQMKIIEGIKEGHYIINGLPGTGKTKILESIAYRELAQGKNVLFTCFNKLLCNKVAENLGNDVAKTLAKLYYPFSKKLGNPSDQKDWKKEVKLKFAEMEVDPVYDVLLVDEYQDLDEEDYAILLKLLKPEGLLVLAGDQLQNIVGSKHTWKSLGINVSAGRHRNFFLPIPYRTQPVIVDFALKFICKNDRLYKAADRYFRDNNHEHNFGSFAKLNDMVKFMPAWKEGAKLEIQDIIKKNPSSNILVITCNDAQVVELGLSETTNLLVAPYTKVKGVEADIVVLYNIDFFKKWNPAIREEEKMKMVFSALCRSRGMIFINSFQQVDFYEDLHELYLDCLTEEEGVA